MEASIGTASTSIAQLAKVPPLTPSRYRRLGWLSLGNLDPGLAPLRRDGKTWVETGGMAVSSKAPWFGGALNLPIPALGDLGFGG